MQNDAKKALENDIKVQSSLSEFLSKNKQAKGQQAFEYLVREGFDSKIALETVKKYGREEVEGVPPGTEPTVKPEEKTSDEASSQATGGDGDTFSFTNTGVNESSTSTVTITGEGKDFAISGENLKLNTSDLNTYKQKNAQEKQSTMNKDTTSKKTSSKEMEPPIVDDGAVKGTQTDGVLADGGGGNTKTEGDIWDAETEKQTPVQGDGSATTRSPPAGPAGAVQVSENTQRQFSSGDIKSEKKRVLEYYRKLDRLEAGRNMKVADARIAAKERYLKEKRLDGLIKRAKEGSKQRAHIAPKISRKAGEGVGKKITAREAEVYGPLQWMKAVAKELNVPSSYLWKLNKQDSFESSNSRFLKAFDANENVLFTPMTQEQKVPATEAVTGPVSTDFMRIMSEQVLVLPNGKVVTPIRQFCETKVLPPGTREAFFYDFGAVTFTDVGLEDGTNQVGESGVVMRSAGGPAIARGTRLTLGYTQLEESPIDIIAAANRSYALESVNDESIEAIQRSYNDDTGSSGDATNRKAKGGGTKATRWVDNSGTQITADASGLGNMQFAGLVAAKGVIEDEGLDPSNIITYTTGKAIRDLIFDPDLDSFISFSRPAIITEATVERIAGTNVVRSSAPASGTQTDSFRSVMFIPNIALGLVTGRDLTMEAQRRNELQVVYLTGTQRIEVYVKNVEATCRISHL